MHHFLRVIQLIEKDPEAYEKEKVRLQNITSNDSIQYLKGIAENVYLKQQNPVQTKEEYVNEIENNSKERGVNQVIAELKDKLNELEHLEKEDVIDIQAERSNREIS